MKKVFSPKLITFHKINFDKIDFDIKIIEENLHIPFSIKRVYWLRSGNTSLERGRHAHMNSSQLIVALSGKVEVNLTDLKGKIYNYSLDSQDFGLFIPPKYWLNILLPPNALLLCISSLGFDEQDTIYDFKDFLKLA